MKAAVLKKYGSVDQFTIKDIPVPELKDSQILIRNYASSVNPVDTLVRKGKMKLLSGSGKEKVIGSDFSGVVLASRSKKFKIGDEVFGFLNSMKGKAYAEIVQVSDECVVHKPSNLSFTEAAVLPMVGLTAWRGIVTEGKVQEGDRVLVLGCTGGVGSAAVQIAKKFGAYVTGACSAKHVDFAYQLGCNLVYNYEMESVPETEIYDLIFDATGLYHLSDFEQRLTAEAMFISTRGGANDFLSGIESAMEIAFKKKMKVIVVKPKVDELLILKEMVENNELKPLVARTFPIEQIGEAHLMVEEGSFTGKVAVEI